MTKLRRYDAVIKTLDGKLKHYRLKITVKNGRFTQETEYKKENYDGKQGD